MDSSRASSRKSSSVMERKSSMDAYGSRKSSSSLIRKFSNVESNRKRTISGEVPFEDTMTKCNRDVTYGDIVNRTREKLQVVKALRMVRKTHRGRKVDHSNDENKCDIKNQVIFEQGKVKLSTIDEIKAEARKAVNMVKAERLRAQLNARVETLRRFNNYSSVLKIVDEIDEEMKVEEAMRREQEAANKLPQAKENAMFAPLSPIIDLTSYMSPGQKKPEDVSGPEEDSDSIGDTSSITSVVFELKSPVKCTITSPLPPARVSPKTNLRSASFSAAATSNAMGLIGLKSPPNARANTRATILSPPGSASKRRGSHMRESVVDDRTKQMATMRMQAEELHRQALINKLMAKEAKLMKNEKQKEMVGMLKQLSMVVMLLSRVGCMHRLIVERRAAMAHQIAQQKLLRSVVWVQRWWYFVKIKLCMKRNPLSVEKIRMVVLCGIRIRRLKKRHQGIALMKEFLFSSVILKDMVAKIYGYRRKAIRVQRWARSYFQIRQARLMALSLYVTKMRNIFKAEQRDKSRKQELKMRRALKMASGFGVTMAKIDVVAKKINDTLEVEKEKSFKRDILYANQKAAREKKLDADNPTGRGGTLAHHGRTHRSKSSGDLRLQAGGSGQISNSMADVILLASGSIESNIGAAERYFAPDYPYIKKKKVVRAKFPSPKAFIHQLYQTENGRAQLQYLRRILNHLRKLHIASFEINERRRMFTSDCVRVEHVAQYLKPVDKTQQTDTSLQQKNMKLDLRARMEQSLKSKKQLAAEAAESIAYNDKLLLTEIIHSNSSLFNTPFLMLTSSKSILLDEIKNLPEDIFV